MVRIITVFSVASQYCSRICGKMSVDLLANKKHLIEVSGSLCLHIKRDKRNLEADVTSCVNGAIRNEFRCENIAFVLNNKHK